MKVSIQRKKRPSESIDLKVIILFFARNNGSGRYKNLHKTDPWFIFNRDYNNLWVDIPIQRKIRNS